MSCLLTGVLLTVVMFLWNNVRKIVFLVPKVCCWLYGVRLGCGSWVHSFHFAIDSVRLAWRNWTHRQLWLYGTDHSNGLHSSVCARSEKLISGDCYRISHLISSDLKLISTSYHDFYCCILFRKKRSCISGNCYVEYKLYIYLLTFDTLCIQKMS